MSRPAPYPAETRAKGWRFELDYEQIEQSSTWALAGPEARPWLLMLWMTAWRQVPCGSLPAEHDVIAAMIGMPAKTWAKVGPVLLRGWSLCDDGRLYHSTISQRVQEMLDYRAKQAKRVADFKARQREERAANALPTGEQKASNDTGTGTGTGTGTVVIPKPSEAIASGSTLPGDGAPPPVDPPEPPAPSPPPPEPPSLRETAFALGVPMLTTAGVVEKNARSFLAMQSKTHGDAALVAALERCAIDGAGDPISWIQRHLKPKASARHAGFEAKDYRAGVTEDGHLT